MGRILIDGHHDEQQRDGRQMKYTHLYTDSDGETPFEDVEVEFEKRPIRPDGPNIELSMPRPSSDYSFAHSQAGFTADYHPTPRRQLAVVLAGVYECGVSDGEIRRFECGEAILLDDMASKGHTSYVVDALAFMFVGLED